MAQSQPFLIRDIAALQLCFRLDVLLKPHTYGTWRETDSTLVLQRPRFSYHFHPVYALRIQPDDIRIDVFQSSCKNYLFVTTLLEPQVIHACEERNHSCADLFGNLLLQNGELCIARAYHHPSKPELPQPAHNDNTDSAGQGTPTPKYQHGNSKDLNVFRGKSAAVPRQLLADPQRTWSLKQMQQAARISSGLAFRVMNQLRTHHLVRGGNADWRLDQPQRLLQEWAAQDRLHKRATLTRYLTEHTDDLATLAAKLMHRPNLRNIAFTQWQAARIQGATENLPIVSFYAHLPLAASDIDALNLRKVLRGGNVWLFQPRTPHDWPLVQTTRKLPIVADHQIFLDLSRAGDFVPNRPDGPEQEIAQLGLEAQPALPPRPSFFQALEPVSLADFTGRAQPRQPCLSATLSPKPRPTPC